MQLFNNAEVIRSGPFQACLICGPGQGFKLILHEFFAQFFPPELYKAARKTTKKTAVSLIKIWIAELLWINFFNNMTQMLTKLSSVFNCLLTIWMKLSF